MTNVIDLSKGFLVFKAVAAVGIELISNIARGVTFNEYLSRRVGPVSSYKMSGLISDTLSIRNIEYYVMVNTLTKYDMVSFVTSMLKPG